MFDLKSTDQICFSVIITKDCNASCNYCHFYEHENKSDVIISKDLFKAYLGFINKFKKKHPNIQIRFSGGEPTVLFDKLFYFSNSVFNTIGIKPYILTNGGLIDKTYLEKAMKNNIGCFISSIENPLENSQGAFAADGIIKKIAELRNYECPLLPGCLIVENSYFKKIPYIAEYIYNQVGLLPIFSEMNFGNYSSPTQTDLDDLYNSMKTVLKKYFTKTPICFFPYIVPELNDVKGSKFLIELSIDDNLNLYNSKESDIIDIFLTKLELDYPIISLTKYNPKYNEDIRVKWLWKNKMDDFLMLRETIYKSYFDALC